MGSGLDVEYCLPGQSKALICLKDPMAAVREGFFPTAFRGTRSLEITILPA